MTFNQTPPKRRLLGAAASVIAAIGIAAPAHATVTARTATLNTGTFAQFNQNDAVTGSLSTISVDTYEGAGAAHATYSGGGTNGFARAIFNVGWTDGDEVYYGGAFYLPEGFHTDLQGEVDIMRHDNYDPLNPSNLVDYGGIGIMNYDKKAHLFRTGSYTPSVPGSGVNDLNVVTPFTLPEGHWFWLEVHQKLSGDNGTAINEVWIDDVKVASSTTANSFGNGVTRLRYGLVSIAQTVQTNPLELWFDQAVIDTSPIGPIL